MHEPEPSYSQRSWRSLSESLKPPPPDAKLVSIVGAYEHNAIAIVNRHVAHESEKLIRLKQTEYRDNEDKLNTLLHYVEDLCQEPPVVVRRPQQYTPSPTELTKDPALKDVPDQACLRYLEKRNILFSRLVENVEGVVAQAQNEARTIATLRHELEKANNDLSKAHAAVTAQQSRIEDNQARLALLPEPDEIIASKITHDQLVLKRKEKKVDGLSNLAHQLQDQLNEKEEGITLLVARLLPEIDNHIATYEREAEPTPLTPAEVTESINRQCRVSSLDFGTEAQQRTIESICEQALSKSIRMADSMLKNLPFAECSCARLRHALEVVIRYKNISPEYKQALEDLTQTHRRELSELISLRAQDDTPHLKIKALKEAAADYELSCKRLDDASREPSFNVNQKKVLLIQAIQLQFIAHCCSNDAAIHKRDLKQRKGLKKKKRS